MLNEAVINACAVVALFTGFGFASYRYKVLKDEHLPGVTGLLINVLLPCLIIDSIVGNEHLQDARLLFLSPLTAFAVCALSFLCVALCCRFFLRFGEFKERETVRSFILGTGLQNYGFVALPIIESQWPESNTGILGVLFLHNVGVEVALWSLGVFVLSGAMGEGWWKKMLNLPLLATMTAFLINAFDGSEIVSGPLRAALGKTGAACIPIGIILCGANMAAAMEKNRGMFRSREAVQVLIPALVLRHLLLPLLILGTAALWFVPDDLRRILVVQAAMPAAFLPIVFSAHYGASVRTAARIAIVSFLFGLLTMSFWMSAGLNYFSL